MKFKHIISVAIAGLVSLCTLTGCGKQEETFYTMLDSLSNMKSYEYEYSVSVESKDNSGEKINLKVSGVNAENGDLTAVISGEVNIPDVPEIKGTLTSIVYKGDSLYVNAKQLLDIIGNVGAEIPTVDGLSDYIKIDNIDSEDLNVESDVSVDIPDANKASEAMRKTLHEVVVFFEKVFKDVEPSPVYINDSVYYFEINDKNAEAIAKALNKAQEDGEIDALLNKIKQLTADVSNSIKGDDFDSTIGDLSKELSELINNLKDLSATDEFRFVCSVSNNNGLTLNILLDTEDMKVNLKLNAKEKKDIKVEAPANAMTLDEYAEAMMSAMFGGFDFDSDFGFDFDDFDFDSDFGFDSDYDFYFSQTNPWSD